MKLTYRNALEASLALMELGKLRLPIKSSIEIARLSKKLDGELKIFAAERDKLVQGYNVIPAQKDEDIMSFSCSLEAETNEETLQLREATLREFSDKFNELLNSETEDLGNKKIILPEDVVFPPKLLKPIEGFIEVG